MTTPQQFIESFLREKTAAYAHDQTRVRLAPVYEKYFGEPLRQHAERFMPRSWEPVIDDTKESRGVVSVIAREHPKLRKRFRLAAAGESWKIIGIDHECFLCRGSGQSGGSRCQKCDGEGWYDETGTRPNPN